MTRQFYEDWGGDQIDLRAAEEHDVVTGEVLSQGVSEGTVSLDSLTFTASTTLEILAIRYTAHVALVLEAGATGPALAARRRRGKAFAITTRTTFGRGRSGDYFSDEVLAAASDLNDDDTNGVGAGFDGTDGHYTTLFDPGLDSPTGQLVIGEGESVRVHLEQVGTAAPSSGSGEQTLRHRLDVWWQERPEAESEVRARGSFPQSGEAI